MDREEMTCEVMMAADDVSCPEARDQSEEAEGDTSF